MKILLSGCGGAMGHNVANLVSEKEDIVIGAGVDKFPPKGTAFSVFSSFDDVDVKCDVIIDFSHPSALDDLLNYAVKKGLPVVLSTTGHDDKQKKSIEEASKSIAIFKSANMSLGVNLMTELLKKAASFLDGFDIEIIEKHHNKKLDSPSGTAYMLADSINEALDNKRELVHGRHGMNAKRHENEIGMHAVRGGAIVGEHQVHFIGPGEVIEIKHTALSKTVFADGAVQAASFLIGKQAGMYDMKDML